MANETQKKEQKDSAPDPKVVQKVVEGGDAKDKEAGRSYKKK